MPDEPRLIVQNMFILETFVTIRLVGHMLGIWNFPHLYWSSEQEEFSILGCHWADWDSMAANLEISAAGCCVCQRPVSCSGLLQTHCHPSHMLSPSSVQPSSSGWPSLSLSFPSIYSLFLLSFFTSTAPHCPRLPSHIPAVDRDPGQSDRVHKFDASVRCGLSRGEG